MKIILFVQFCLIELTGKKIKNNRSSLSSPLKVVEPILLNALYNEIKLKQKDKPMKKKLISGNPPKVLLLSPLHSSENTYHKPKYYQPS